MKVVWTIVAAVVMCVVVFAAICFVFLMEQNSLHSITAMAVFVLSLMVMKDIDRRTQ